MGEAVCCLNMSSFLLKSADNCFFTAACDCLGSPVDTKQILRLQNHPEPTHTVLHIACCESYVPSSHWFDPQVELGCWHTSCSKHALRLCLSTTQWTSCLKVSKAGSHALKSSKQLPMLLLAAQHEHLAIKSSCNNQVLTDECCHLQ